MPETRIAERGGAVRWRTVRVNGKDGRKRYLKVAVVRKKGPRGGRTVASEPKRYG